ncbi:MAG: alpha-galactosidase [Olsenella sp.]|nr:alpha-galactosidase [Olsenella sp.]
MWDTPSIRVSWRSADGAPREAVVREGVPVLGAQADDLGVAVALDGDVCRVSVEPSVGLELTCVEATLEPDLARADALFLNGYNSWTDSWERPVDARMRGLHGTPRAVIDRWVLDTSGDYRFARQDPRPGRQHGIGYGYLRFGERVRLFGELDPDSGVTAIYEDLPKGTIALSKEVPQRTIEAGERVEVLSLALLEGTLDEAVSRYLSLMGVAARPARSVAGYSSWYRHYGDITEEKLLGDLAGVRDSFASLELGGVDLVFQVDDGYATVGDWTAPDAGDFPHGMAHLAGAIRETGMVPGLWIAPFVCERDSALFSEHPDWLLRDKDGVPVMSGSHWSGGYALDTLNPEVRDYVRRVLSMATREWGFELLKLDFLYAAALVVRGGMNRGELMADALDLLRESVPEGTRFDLCGVPLMSALGRCEYCRIGCDVGLDWDDKLYMHIINRERVSTKNSLHNTCGRAHLDGRAFRNDPDVFFLRDDVRLTDEQRSRLLEADATLGGVFFTSDDMGLWSDDQRAAFEAALAKFVARADKE